MDALAKFELPLDQHQIYQMLPENVPQIWSQIEDFLARAITRSHSENITTPMHLLAAILLRRCHLWIAVKGPRIDAAVVTRFIDWDIPGSRSLFCPVLGGRGMKEWFDPMMAAIEHFARANQCMDIRGEFRKGWVRHGFEATGVTLVRKL